MAQAGRRGNPEPVSDLAARLIDPILRKRAGISLSLIQSWDEIAGPGLAVLSRPEKINWPRRMSETDPFEPATLVVACEAMGALRIQHQTGELMARVNAFLGFSAVGRIRIVQKPVQAEPKKRRPVLRALSADEATALSKTVGGIERDDLRASLERLGRSVLASKT